MEHNLPSFLVAVFTVLAATVLVALGLARVVQGPVVVEAQAPLPPGLSVDRVGNACVYRYEYAAGPQVQGRRVELAVLPVNTVGGVCRPN